MMQRTTDAKIEYNRRFGAKAMVLYDTLLQRHSILRRPPTSIQNMALVEPELMAGGMAPVSAGVNTLRTLIDTLPDF